MGALDLFAAGLRRVRADRGFTQQQLAEKANVSLQFYAALEQAKKAPSFDTLDGVCQVLGVTPDELFAVGAPVKEARSKANDDLLRAIERLPRALDADLLDIVHAISRMTATRGAPTAAMTGKRPAKKATTARRPR